MADGWILLLKQIRDGGKLCQVYVTCDGAFKIKKELGGRGFLFRIINEDLTHEEADDFVEKILTVN